VLGNLRTLAIAENHASTDALTGLPNRRALQDTLKRMVAHAGRTLEPLAALAVDLDHFKQVNDRHGHDKGDEVLAAVGALLDESLRASDFASRAGGEEFCVLLPSTDLAGALEIAEKLRAAIARVEVPGVDRESAPASASPLTLSTRSMR
jgi:diguanylate cyclase (GGDEF)-like protein